MWSNLTKHSLEYSLNISDLAGVCVLIEYLNEYIVILIYQFFMSE